MLKLLLTVVGKRYYFTSFREWEEEKCEDLINEVVRLVNGVEIGELTVSLSFVLFNPAYIISQKFGRL